MSNKVRSVVVGYGAYLPERIVTNQDLSQQVDTSDAWIVERTGIEARHIAALGQFTSHLAIRAAEQALSRAGLAGSDLDLIIIGTTTPDETFPSVATKVQAAIGMKNGAAFDLQAVCSGFIYALTVADNFIKAGQARRVMVIGAETMSRLLDWEDRATCVLFGDGAGAVILEAQIGAGALSDRGVLATHIRSDGEYHDLLYTDGGPSSTGTAGHLRMKGREVFRHAVVNLAAAIDAALEAVDAKPEDIDWIVPHQANKRILDATAKKVGVAPEKVVMTVDRHANTSAASIPLALAAAADDGRIKRGDLLLLEAMGGGFTWGSALLRW